MIKIYPYMVGSGSVKKLKSILCGQIIKLENSRYRYRTSHNIINWGNSRRPSWMTTDVPVLNKPEAVAVAGNKLDTLSKLEEDGVATVEWTELQGTAQRWVDEGHKVFVRHSLTGHSGEGIEVVQQNENVTELGKIATRLRQMGCGFLSDAVIDYKLDIQDIELNEAPLYTLGVENNGEYRVHVFNSEVILYQKKSRRVDESGEMEIAYGEDADIRNLESNWVYRTGNLRRLDRVEQLAISAVNALGLDFGAVDIIKDENGDVFVLEVNTAPGLGNTETLGAYANAFCGEQPIIPDELTYDV